MNVYIVFIVLTMNLYITNAYILVQIKKKDKNLTNIDAIIHKTVDSDKVGQITNEMHRKQFDADGRPEMQHVMRVFNNEETRNNLYPAKIEEKPRNSLSDFSSIVTFLVQKLDSFNKGDSRQSNLKKQHGKFRSGHKGPKAVYELNPENIIDSINSALSSKTVLRIIDTITISAANLVRRFLNNEFDPDLLDLIGSYSKTGANYYKKVINYRKNGFNSNVYSNINKLSPTAANYYRRFVRNEKNNDLN